MKQKHKKKEKKKRKNEKDLTEENSFRVCMVKFNSQTDECQIENLKGYCTPNQKLACFVLYLNQHFPRLPEPVLLHVFLRGMVTTPCEFKIDTPKVSVFGTIE